MQTNWWQRFQKLTANVPEPTLFNGIVIESISNVGSPATRDLVGESLSVIIFPVAPSSPLILHLIKQEVNSPTCRELINFYDCDPTVCEWYYQAYSDKDRSLTTGVINSVANILVKPHQPKMVRKVVILKNGLAGGQWNMTPDIDPKALEQMLWWYHRSRRDIRIVSTKRGLMHLALNYA